MVKHRLIPILLFKEGWLVRSQEFCFFQKIGNPHIQFKRLISWDLDELICLDISENPYMRSNQLQKWRLRDHLRSFSSQNFTPLAVGGGIRSVQDAELLIRNGADRLIINTKANQDPNFISDCAKKFGSQAVVVSIDTKTSREYKKIVYKIQNLGDIIAGVTKVFKKLNKINQKIFKVSNKKLQSYLIFHYVPIKFKFKQ